MVYLLIGMSIACACLLIGFLRIIKERDEALADLAQAMAALRERIARVDALERQASEGNHRERPKRPMHADELPEEFRG